MFPDHLTDRYKRSIDAFLAKISSKCSSFHCESEPTQKYYNDIIDDVDQKPTAHKESVGRKHPRRSADPPHYPTSSHSKNLPLPSGESEPTQKYYDVDQKSTIHKWSVGRKRQRRCTNSPHYPTPSPSKNLPLPSGEFEPTKKCYNDVVDDVIRNSQFISGLSEGSVRDEVLILLTTRHHRLARFFHRLLSVARQSSQSSTTSIIAAESVELLIDILPDLHQLLETTNVLDSVSPALDVCFLSSQRLVLDDLTDRYKRSIDAFLETMQWDSKGTKKRGRTTQPHHESRSAIRRPRVHRWDTSMDADLWSFTVFNHLPKRFWPH